MILGFISQYTPAKSIPGHLAVILIDNLVGLGGSI